MNKAIIGLTVFISLLTNSVFAAETLLLTGSSTAAPLMSEIGLLFEKKFPKIKVEVQTGGSTKGLTDLQQGLNDIGMLSRDLTPEEKDVKSHLIAFDGLVFAVHKKNAVKKLTTEQIKKIYKGEVTNWKDVGGPDRKITVISKVEGRAALDLFVHQFGVKPSEIKAQSLVGDNEHGLKLVKEDESAIAYLSVSTVDTAVKAGETVSAVTLDGVDATPANIKNGKYKFTRSIILVTNGKSKASALDFVKVAQSNEVNNLIEKLGFVTIK